MPTTTLILSDTHLGRPKRATAEALRPVWQGVDHLVINGDVAEVQIPRLRVAAAREVDRLVELTKQDGVALTLISGNHDAYLTDTRCLQLAGGRVLVMHGDALHPAVAPWTRSAKAMQRLTDRALAEVPGTKSDCLHTRLSIAQHVGHSEFLEEHVLSSRGEGGLWKAIRRPWEVPRVLHYWRSEPKLAHLFAQRYAPAADFVILGHSHHPGLWRRGGRTIINTGGFAFPAKPWCAVYDGQTLRVEKLKRDKRGFSRAAEPVDTFACQDPSQEQRSSEERSQGKPAAA